ncbi:class I SAM-dependent methyltransferase [Cryptosporangium aurantiacum]|uniref:Methyltransferase domain-containing protein n=1 Tax=Cryptosporangium aurantiacum TaxID=134849 RepID=A0A1M7RAH1_9ACTN|nr:class I SAM-dependent methyltransferase [Cryptosporangium aurantiacum]SHN43345.1 Methyltransferase domain-containing protein [Cryptosporangium aurantiacum]
METTDEQATQWNGTKGSAWVSLRPVLDDMYRPLEELLVDVVRDRAGATVLDVGCGAGSTTVALARHAGRCVGVDVAEPMIAAARTRPDAAAAEFLRADAQDHPFPPRTFDTVVSRFGVMFFADPVRAFTNLRRAATDDAVLRLIVWRPAEENPFMTTAEEAAAPLLPNLPVRRPGEPGQFAFGDPSYVRDVLARSGWADVALRPIDVPCAFPENRLVDYFTGLGAVGLALPEADDRTRDAVIRTVRAAFEPFVDGAEVRFTAACWMVDAPVR